MASTKLKKAPPVEDALGQRAVASILGVHPRTVQRRQSTATRSILKSAREQKLHGIWEELLTLYSPENAVRWLKGDVPALGSRTPLAVMVEDGGLDRVSQTVGRMSWGISD